MRPTSLFASCAIALILGLAPVSCPAWDGPHNLTADFNAAAGDFFPDAVSDSAGNVHVLWCSAVNSSNWQIYHRTKYAGGGWSAVELVGGSSANWVRCAVDASDNLHVAWHGGSSQAGTEVFYRKRAAGGTWGSVTNISNSSVASMFPDIACDGLGRVFVVWHENITDGDKNWDLAMARFNGTSWLAYERITSGSRFDVYPVIACDAANTLHVIWTSYDEIYYKTRSSAGVWSSEDNVSRNSGSSRDPDLAVTASGVPHVVWHDNSPGNWEEYYAKKVGGTWVGPTNLSNNASATDCYGAVAVGGDGSVNVIWQDYANVYFARDFGSGFNGWIKLYAGTNTKHTKVCVDPGYDVHLVWQDRTPGEWDIQYMTHVYPDITPPGQATAFSASGSDQKVYLNWHNPSDMDYSGTIIRFKPTGYPTSPTDGTLLCDRLAARGSDDSYIHTGLPNGATYYYSAFTYDAERVYSARVESSATTGGMNCASAKQLANNTPVDLYGKVVTANFVGSGGFIYVEEPNRCAGIRVVTSQAGLALGDRVAISGKLATIYNNGYPAERSIQATSVTRSSTGAELGPLAMKCYSIGGGPAGPLVPGVKDAVGLNNIGLLVKIAGRVTFKIADIFYVDDGASILDPMGRVGVMIQCPSSSIPVSVGNIVSVTGVVAGSVGGSWTTNRRCIYLRSYATDLILIRP